jgi:hypothetical protein
MSKSKKHAKPEKPSAEESREPSKLDPLWRALEWPGATGWVGTLFAITALWFFVSALVLGAKRARMETPSPDARVAAQESRTWGFGDRFLTSVLRPNEAGVMVRNSAEPGAKFVAVVLGSDGKAAVLVRSTPGQPPTRMPLRQTPGMRPPEWVSLSRKNGVIEVSVSGDGVAWNTGSLRRKLALPGAAIVGLVTFPATHEPCVATFRSVSLRPGKFAVWKDAGEGEVAPPPPSRVSGSTAVVASGGAASSEAGGSSHFAFASVRGVFGIVAHVGKVAPAYVLPAPLVLRELARTKAALGANAKASGVFSFFAAVLAALLWGLRRFDPSVRAEATARAAERKS